MRSSKLVYLITIFLFSFSVMIIFSDSVSAADCYAITSQTTCDTTSGCKWGSDSWGASCKELNCWNLNSQSQCTTTTVPGKNCTWTAGGTTYGCEKISCWNLGGVNSNSCVNNSLGLSCDWSDYCYMGTGGGGTGANCYENRNQSSCLNMSGCSWGQCTDKGCWSYGTQATCNPAKDWNGRNCTWINSSGSTYCAENGCWRYSNSSACANSTGITCTWKWNSCQDVNCWTWDYTNASACVNNTANLTCTWSNNYCMQQDCWSHTTNATCSQKQNCLWKSYVTSGWCEEVQCWTWNSVNGGSKNACEQNSTFYGLNCIWDGNPPGDAITGWCQKNMATIGCSNKTTERSCMDTYYCWWMYIDFNNPSLGGTCNAPGSIGIGAAVNTTVMNEWNPGCYLFDMNATTCNYTLGCNHSVSKCNALAGHANYNAITTSGINCSMLNDSQLCNNIPMFSSCCAWQNGSCSQNKLSTACWDQMKAPPAGASFCEDYSSYTNQQLCEQIAGSPWYMPCVWDNSTGKCSFKAADVFGNGTQTLVKIDNKKSCEAAGGKWIMENYCQGNISAPSGRCEYKFDAEDNCDRVCFACELKDSNGKTVNSSNAQSACLGSALGACQFEANTAAPNGVGFCKAKTEFKKGIAADCDANCGDCTYKGDPNNNDTQKRPSYYCTVSKANSAGGGCKWVSDNTTTTGGYCVKKGDKTCDDTCDRCTTQSNCANIGRTTVANQSGSCKWEGGESTGSCVANIGEDVEICWDAIDNNDNGLVDCADASCYTDSFCGFVTGDCFGWTTEATCEANSCEWITDKWGNFCDFKGARCWKYDNNIENCTNQSSCQWNNGTGTSSGWCEQDWSRSETCMGLARDPCMRLNTSGCNWTVDSWCSGSGNGTTWCNSNGGWCDYDAFKPKNCWSYTSGSAECISHTGCSWRTDSYSQAKCEVNWSANCWQYSTNATCSALPLCWWRSDSGGYSWCSNIMDKCWNSYNVTDCNAKINNNNVSICYWDSWGSNCQPLCFNSTKSTSTSCNAVLGCVWKENSGWCEEGSTVSCTNSSNYNHKANCTTTTGCRWKNSGWCDPKGGGFSGASNAGGGGVGAAIGADCFKYDGNQSLCTNKSAINISCGWFAEQNPKCEVDWSKDCWKYTTEQRCNSTVACWWKNDSYSSYCTNIMDQCWSNQTLQSGGAAICSANALCNATSWGGCEPKCTSQTTGANCVAGALAGKCRWLTGYCNPSGMNNMFTNMEAGAPVPLGTDSCGEVNISQKSVDICGFGMRDMKDSYGFGTNVYDFSNASVCNKEKLSSFVMGMVGGATGSFGTERIGSGNDTVIFVVYLDTDGSTTGGCELSHNSSAAGYEFRFKYTSQWNSNTSKAVETFNAYKCDDSDWKSTDIKLSAWKKMMCSDIGGAMIAVEKADLARFPTLYNSTKDIRVYVASIGSSGNISSPTDTAGPAWTTPGSIDFDIANAFAYGADTAKFENIMKKGYVQGEDCFNTIDDDNDGASDCSDWDCQYSIKCTTTGVNAVGYVDTTTPLVTGVIIEEYPDAALISYETNKPTNGTLELYGADSKCLNKTDTIYDIGILRSTKVRTYKPWHYAKLYNDGNIASNISLDYALANGVSYYYKLKVCDSSGKCAVSKCSNFTTPASESKCGYCNFVARIKTPSGWNASYDANLDGTYEHVQGCLCGPNAGMKTNYTVGRLMNVKLAKSDGSAYIEFLNATVTKTGLNDKVRTISNATDMIGSSTLVGLTSESRDKLINNLHPEICRIKIPNSGTCTILYYCDDSGGNCVDRTVAAGGAPINATECVWEVPYCEFSSYKTNTAGGGGSTGGGGGGGAAAVTGAVTYIVTDTQFKAGYTKSVGAGDKLKFKVSEEDHYLTVDSVTSIIAKITVTSAAQEAYLNIGDEKKFDVNTDNFYDISVKLNSINATAKKGSITIKSISEAVPAAAAEKPAVTTQPAQASQPAETQPAALVEEALETEGTPSDTRGLWIVALVIVIFVFLVQLSRYLNLIGRRKRKK